MRKARDHLKKLSNHLPQESNFKGLVKIAYQASQSTTTVIQQVNSHTCATGTTGAARVADFNFPFSVDFPPASKKRKASTPSTSSFANIPELEDEEQDTLEDEPEEEKDVKVTRSHQRELKKGDMQCFCAGAAFETLDDLKKHKEEVHLGKGIGVNKKTGNPNDLWKCSACEKVSEDNRACSKHFRTNHLGLFIHYCPVEGCTEGSDQKDTIISHITKNHADKKDLFAKCKQQKFLRCKKCLKQFISVKGKNSHELKCGEPVVKIKCPFQNCFKAYKIQGVQCSTLTRQPHRQVGRTWQIAMHCGGQ